MRVGILGTGSVSEHSLHVSQAAREQGKTYPSGNPVSTKVTPSFSSIAVTIPGQAECSCPGSISSSTVLLPSTRKLAEVPSPYFRGNRTMILCSHCPRRQ